MAISEELAMEEATNLSQDDVMFNTYNYFEGSFNNGI
jgi:hypothetical protein